MKNLLENGWVTVAYVAIGAAVLTSMYALLPPDQRADALAPTGFIGLLIGAALRGIRGASSVLAVVFASMMTMGCGSAITTNARTATVATHALTGARELIIEASDTAIERCDTTTTTEDSRIECVSRAQVKAEVAGAAYDSVRLALIAYRQAIDIAATADTDQDVLASAVRAGAELIGEWNAFRVALAALGVEAPALPDVRNEVSR